METSNENISLNHGNEQRLVVELRCLIEEFLNTGKGSLKVREFLSSVKHDDVLLLIYIKGRKYRVQHAFETLQRKAEVRFNKYPQLFPDELTKQLTQLQRSATIAGIGVLKCRANSGARICVWNTEEWDLDKINLEQNTILGTYYMDRLLFDEDAIKNGVIIIKNCAGLGIKHGIQYTLPTLQSWLHVFWYACPIKVEALYIINVPFYHQYIYKMIRPFLTKKMKERVILTTKNKQFKALHERVLPKLLPKVLGGVQENETAFDSSFHNMKLPA